MSSGRRRAAGTRCSLGPGQVALVQGHPGGHGVDQGADRVVVELPGLARSPGPARPGPRPRPSRRVPIATMAALGQGDRGGRQRPGVGARPRPRGPGPGRPGRRRRRAGSATPSSSSAVARHGLAGLSPASAAWASAPHLGHAVAAQQRPQQRQVALASCCRRGAGPPADRPAFGGIRPALGRRRPAHQRVDPGPEHGDRRVALDQPLVLEPLDPAQDGVDPSAGVGRLHQAAATSRATRSASPAAWAWSMASLGQPVGLAPGGRPRVELAGPARARAAPARRGAARGTGGGSGTTRGGGPAGPAAGWSPPATPAPRPDAGGQDGVAQRPATSVQHRRAGQERHHSGGRCASSSDRR